MEFNWSPDGLQMNNYDFRWLIERQIEKKRIREQIIAAERQILEKEVRMELMIEKERNLRAPESSTMIFGSSFSSQIETRSVPSQFGQLDVTRMRSLSASSPTYRQTGFRQRPVPVSVEGSSSVWLGTEPPLEPSKEMITLISPKQILKEKMPVQAPEPFATSIPCSSPSQIATPLVLVGERFGEIGCQGFEQFLLQNPQNPVVGSRPSSDWVGTETPVETRKEKIILGKPNLQGEKRNFPNHETDDDEANDTTNSKKKAKKWYCTQCHVNSTSEIAFNQHMQGKKHRAKEARLVLQETDYKIFIVERRCNSSTETEQESMQTGQERAMSPFEMKVTVDEKQTARDTGLTVQKAFLGADHLVKICNVSAHTSNTVTGSTRDPSVKANEKLTGIENGEAQSYAKTDLTSNVKAKGVELIGNGDISGHETKTPEKSMFWCQICKWLATSAKDMSIHQGGKKHLAKLNKAVSSDFLLMKCLSMEKNASNIKGGNASAKETEKEIMQSGKEISITPFEMKGPVDDSEHVQGEKDFNVNKNSSGTIDYEIVMNNIDSTRRGNGNCLVKKTVNLSPCVDPSNQGLSEFYEASHSFPDVSW